MTSTQSQNNHNAFLIRLKQHLSKSIIFGILLFVFVAFIGCNTVRMFISQAAYDLNSIYLEDVVFSVSDISPGMFLACCVFAVLITVRCFDHLHKKSIVDMTYSLPVNSSQRFWASYVAGAVLIIGGILIGLGIIVAFNEISASSNANYHDLLENSGLKSADVSKVFVQDVLLLLSQVFLLYTAAVFVFSNCGELFDACAYTLGICLLPIILSAVFYAAGESICNGYFYFDTPEYWRYLSPFALLMIGDYSIVFYENDKLNLDLPTENYLIFFAISVVLTVFAYFIHTKRRSEHVGKPFAFKPLYYVVSTAVILIFGMLVYCSYIFTRIEDMRDYYNKMLIIAVIISMLVFIVLEVLAERKKRPTKKRIIIGAARYVLTMAAGVCVGIAAGRYAVNCALEVPDIDDVECAMVWVAAHPYDAEYDEYGELIINDEEYAIFNSWRNEAQVDYESKEALEDILAFTNQASDIQREYYNENSLLGPGYEIYNMEDTEDFYYYIEIVLELKNGECIAHNYDRRIGDIAAEWIVKYFTDDIYAVEGEYEYEYGYEDYYPDYSY